MPAAGLFLYKRLKLIKLGVSVHFNLYAMGYSSELENLIDHALIDDIDLNKKKMFGGVSYFLNGNLCFGIYENFLVLRTGKEHAADLLENEGFRPFDITGTAMTGWVMADSQVYRNPDRLRRLLDEGKRYASSLPSKDKK